MCPDKPALCNANLWNHLYEFPVVSWEFKMQYDLWMSIDFRGYTNCFETTP